MTNLDGLERSSIEARIEYLIEQRMKDHGERREFAELQVTRTEEGRTLWERARALRLSESADVGPRSSFTRTSASLMAEQGKLESMIEARMSECGEGRDTAELAVVHTPAGLELWERVRALRLAESTE